MHNQMPMRHSTGYFRNASWFVLPDISAGCLCDNGIGIVRRLGVSEVARERKTDRGKQ